MTLHAPFDFENIFIGDLAGSIYIAFFLGLIGVSYLLGKLNIPGKVVLPIYVLFAIVMAAVYMPFFVIVIILAALAIFYSIGRLWQ